MQNDKIGSGRMGAGPQRRRIEDVHKRAVYDASPSAVKILAGRGLRSCGSIVELLARQSTPRAVRVIMHASVTAAGGIAA